MTTEIQIFLPTCDIFNLDTAAHVISQITSPNAGF